MLEPHKLTLSSSSILSYSKTLSAYLSKSNDYLNLNSIVFVRNTTMTTDYYSFILNIEVRQGPADGVTPVFTPMNPSTHNSLFVFCHLTVRLWLNILLNIWVLCYFFITIYLKNGFDIAKHVSLAMSVLVEYAFSFISPWEFAKWVFFSCSSCALLFM